eukprot:scaffold45800_cov32-Prasinocladus_malaysianus.AAC.1
MACREAVVSLCGAGRHAELSDNCRNTASPRSPNVTDTIIRISLFHLLANLHSFTSERGVM